MARDARDRRGAGRARQPQARQHCLAAGCGKPTTERKPYCMAHLDHLPYVRELQAHLAGLEGEAIVAAQSARKIDIDGLRARDIIEVLAHHGAMSPKRLRIVLSDPSLSDSAVHGYLVALERAGLLKVLTLGSIRGTPRKVVTITAAGRARAQLEAEGAA